MVSKPRWLLASLLLLLTACAPVQPPGRSQGRWIRFDPATQRYGISAQQITRGELLDELRRIASVDVRPQPAPNELLSIQGRDLDLAELLARLLPAEARSVTRWGEREAGAGSVGTEKRKQGRPFQPTPGLVPKSDTVGALVSTGDLKKPADAAPIERLIEGPRTKPPADAVVRVADAKDPKVPLAHTIERATVRLTLEFESDAPPRLVAAQSIEGRAPPERFTRGTHVFALVRPDGHLAQYGSFQDPLIEHSYLPDGSHGVRRAKSGVAAISILRENLAGARLLVVDASGLALPRELSEEVVRGALTRGKRLVEIDTEQILRSLDQAGPK